MKKILCLILSVVLLLSLCACKNDKANNNSEIHKTFTQEVTIVKMPSPPKCKTTDDSSVVNEVIAILGQINKSPTNRDDINGGWSTMIKLKIDGKEFNYTIGSVFTDSDGKQYNVTNYKEIEDKLTKIYNELDVPEVDYP